MNTKIKSIAIFGAGLILGGLSTYFAVRRHVEKVCEALLQEEIASVRDYSDKRGPRKGVIGPNDRCKKEDLSNLVSNLRYGGDVTAEEAMADPDELEMGYTREYHNYESSEKINDKPYVISIEQFNEENTNFDKLTITYYEDDDTLADDGEEIISDVESAIGNALDHFGEESDDPEIVYVRNEKMGIDYEVVRLSKSYKETVLGQ